MNYWKKWRQTKIEKDSIPQTEKIAFDMTINSLKYQIIWHEEILNNIDQYIALGKETRKIIQSIDFSDVDTKDVKAFAVLNEIKFGKLTVVIPNDETLIAIMVSEYIATQIPLNQNVLDTLLTHSDPSKSHSIYITLGSNNKNIDFNRFCTLIDRYEKFFDDFEDDNETYTEDKKKEETVTLIEHKPNEHANKNRQTNINNNNNNRPNQQKHINKQSHKNDNQSFGEIDEDFFLDENEEDDDKGYKNSNENK